MVVAAHRVAVIGGDGRLRPGLVEAPEVVVFKSPRDGGNGDARRLEAALRAGSFGTLIVLTRWTATRPRGSCGACARSWASTSL